MDREKFAVVVAVTSDWGIGKDGRLPWHPKRLHVDMSFLKFITTNDYQWGERDDELQFAGAKGKNVVIFGRKTWESIPPRFRPMNDRHNIIITSNVEGLRGSLSEYSTSKDVHVAGSYEEAIKMGVQLTADGGRIYILGGSNVYACALKDPRCEAIFITRLVSHKEAMPCNVLFPGQLMETRFKSVANITKLVFDTLLPSLPTGANVGMVEKAEDAVIESDVTYKIELWKSRSDDGNGDNLLPLLV